MNILKFLFAIALFSLCLTVKAQVNNNPAIQKRLDTFIELTNQKKFSEAFDLMYPKMFDQISKQDLVDLMTSMDNEGLSLQISNRRITSFSAPLQEGNETFVRLDYTADMQVEVETGSTFDSPKAAQAMMQQFQATYGEPNVAWDGAKKYTIQATKAMMAIQQDGGEWYLVEINPDQKELMEALFPEPVRNALVKVE